MMMSSIRWDADDSVLSNGTRTEIAETITGSGDAFWLPGSSGVSATGRHEFDSGAGTGCGWTGGGCRSHK